MTFYEAQKLKSTLPDEIVYNETPMKVFIVPLDDLDFKNYMAYHYLNKIDDKSSIAFSKNGEFTVHALSKVGSWNLYLTLDKLIDFCNGN